MPSVISLRPGHPAPQPPDGLPRRRRNGASAAWGRPFAVTAAAAAVLTAASYIRWAATGSFKIDDNYLHGPLLVLNVILVLGSLAAAGYAYFKIVLRRQGWDLDLAAVRRLAVLTAVITSFMMPMLSNDVFSRLAYGDLANQGLNPYTQAGLLRSSAYGPLVGSKWAAAPCVYGPVTVTADRIAAWAGRRSTTAGLFVMHIIQLAFALLFIYTAGKYFERNGAGGAAGAGPGPSSSSTCAAPPADGSRHDLNTAALVMLAPIFWLSGTGQGHNDIIVAAFLMLMLLLLKKGKFTAGALAMTLAIATKSYALMTVPLFLGLTWSALKNDRRRLALVLAVSLAVAAGTVVLVHAPYFDHGRGITMPMEFLHGLQTSRSTPRIISTAAAVSEDMLGAWTGRRPALPRETRARAIEAPLTAGMEAASLLLAVYLLAGLAFRHGFDDFVVVFAALSAVLICYFCHTFHPWYFAGFIPLFTAEKRKEWVLWAAAVFAFSGSIDVMELAGYADLPVRGLAAVITLSVNILFFWNFRARFERPAAETGASEWYRTVRRAAAAARLRLRRT